MEYSHIIQIRGEAARPQFLNNFQQTFGWDLRKQGFGTAQSITFIKEKWGELASELENKVKKSDVVYITSVESLLSTAGQVNSVTDRDFYRDTSAIRSLPFEIKADFLFSLLLDQCPSGFFSWLGQRHIAVDEECFHNLQDLLKIEGVEVNVKGPEKV